MTCDAKFTGSQQTLTRCKLSRLSPIQEHARCKPLKAARNLFIILNLSAHMKCLPNICKSPKYCQATPLFTPFVAPSTISDDDDHHHVFNCNLSACICLLTYGKDPCLLALDNSPVVLIKSASGNCGGHFYLHWPQPMNCNLSHQMACDCVCGHNGKCKSLLPIMDHQSHAPHRIMSKMQNKVIPW